MVAVDSETKAKSFITEVKVIVMMIVIYNIVIINTYFNKLLTQPWYNPPTSRNLCL